MENNKLFVTNLNFNTPLQKLVELCAGYGPVKDSYRPEGKGFAFITMQSGEDAKRIIDELTGTMLDGRPLRFELSVPKESRPPRPEGSGSGPSRPSSPGQDRPRFSTPPPFSGGPPNQGRKDDRKKAAPKKEEDFNKTPVKSAKAKQEKIRGGANRNRWIDDLDEDDSVNDSDLDLNLSPNEGDDSES